MRLNVIILRDPKTNTFTAFVKEFPGVVIQASDKNNVPAKLQHAWDIFVGMLQKQKKFNYSESEIA